MTGGEAKPPRQDIAGLCRTSLWGVGDLKTLVHVFKKKTPTHPAGSVPLSVAVPREGRCAGIL